MSIATPAAPTATATASATKQRLPVAVNKPSAYTFDLGLLLANDPNPPNLDRSNLEQSLAEVARDGAQSLVNQLLTTCKIESTPSGILLSLPASSTPLPREKPVPAAKPPTKWEQFAARKGIKPKTREARANRQYNEATGEWERKWGYKGANKAEERQWLIEVDPAKEAQRKEGTTVRGDSRRERKERIKRNERKMRRNAREGDKAGKRR